MGSQYRNRWKRRDNYEDVLISKKRNAEADINEVFYSREFSKVCYKRGINDIVPLSHIGNLVESVTGLNTDNTDPVNPVVKIATDNNSILGEGTPDSPLYTPAFVAGLYGLFSQTSSSAAATGISETSLIGDGVGGLTVPANMFRVGDSFHAKMGGRISCANNETLQIFVKADGVLLEDTGVMTISATNEDFWEIEIDFTIQAVGGVGVASIVSNGQFVYVRNSTLDYKGVGFNFTNNTSFDTTIANALEITAKWGSDNVLNRLITDSFVLYKTFAGQ